MTAASDDWRTPYANYMAMSSSFLNFWINAACWWFLGEHEFWWMNIPCSFSTCMTYWIWVTGDTENPVQMFRWRTNRRIFATRLTPKTNCERQRRFFNANIALCPLMENKLSTTLTVRTRRYFACRKTILWDSTAKKSLNPSILVTRENENLEIVLILMLSPLENFHQLATFVHCIIVNHITLTLAGILRYNWGKFLSILTTVVHSDPCLGS